MKSAIITSTIVVASCALLTSAAPAGHPDSNLVARGSKVSKIAKPLEKWALNPQSMMDRDQRKKNREDAVKIATGSGSGSATRQRHPELQKAMNAIKATNAFAEAGKRKKRAVYDEEFEARDFEDFESELVARASKAGGAAKAIGKAAEKFILNPQSMTDRDQRKKNRDNAITLATGGNTGGGARTRHPEIQKAMDAAKYKGIPEKKKRAFDEIESELVTRASKAAGIGKAIGKAAEKFILNPQSMADRDQRKKNRDNAITLATGGNTGGGARTRHPEIQKAMDAAKFKGIPGKKKRAFDDIESELVTRASKAGGAAKAIGKAAEKFMLNPQSMTDRDQREKNRNNAITLATGGNTGGGARTRHPELQKAMDAAKYKGTKKRALEEEVEAREFDEEFEARDFDDFEDDIFAREFYGLDELD